LNLLKSAYNKRQGDSTLAQADFAEAERLKDSAGKGQ